MSDSVDAFRQRMVQVWERIEIYEGEEVFLETYAQAGAITGQLYAAHFAQSEICNGGFRQLFSNSTGILAPEACEGMRLVGMSEVATIIARAMALFGTGYPRNRSERQGKLKEIDQGAFGGLDKEFFKLIAREGGGFEHATNAFLESVLAE